MYKATFRLAIAIASLLALSAIVLAQSSKGVLVGTVTDPTGSVITGASVKVTNSATNVTRETVSRSEGSYRLDAVDPGIYKIEVGASGFKTMARDRVVVAAGQTTEVSVKLDIGSQNEVVNVRSEERRV